MPLSREQQDQRECNGVKKFQSPGWYVVLLFWQIKIINRGRYYYIILHILTHGSRCVVSAWIPVSNYLSASAHWCHSFPVITQSPACQGQVTSRWAWLVLNGALSPILSPGDRTASQQTQHLGLCPSSPFSFSYGQYFTTDNDPSEIATEGILLRVFHMTRCQFLFTREQLITVDKLMRKVSFWVHLVSPNLIQPVHYTCPLHLGC